MAMEYRQTILDAHNKTIIAIQYNPFRREIYTAGEGEFKSRVVVIIYF